MAKRDFLEVMKEAITAIAPGLENFGPEVKAELSRLGTQGAMEMAQTLFNGAAFTPYGPGQYTPTPDWIRATSNTRSRKWSRTRNRNAVAERCSD